MLACWREGIVPLLQMHDCLDCSVSTREQAELVARLGEEAVKLDVPMKVDLKYGRNWGDAKHSWEELHQTSTTISVEHQTSMVVSMPEEDRASVFGVAVEREVVSATEEANPTRDFGWCRAEKPRRHQRSDQQLSRAAWPADSDGNS